MRWRTKCMSKTCSVEKTGCSVSCTDANGKSELAPFYVAHELSAFKEWKQLLMYNCARAGLKQVFVLTTVVLHPTPVGGAEELKNGQILQWCFKSAV